MRIVIDLQPAQASTRANRVGQTSLELALAMAKQCDAHEIIVALNGSFPETIEPIRGAFDGILPQQNIRVWFMPRPATAFNPADAWRHAAAQALRETFLASLAPDAVLIPGIFEGIRDDVVHSIGVTGRDIPTAVLLHDMLPLLPERAFLDPDVSTTSFYAKQLAHLKRADFFLANSESTRAEAMRCLGIASENCVTIQGAVGKQYSPGVAGLNDYFRQKFGVDRQFIACAAAVEGRENHLRFLQAFASLPASLRSAWQVLIVGEMNPAVRRSLEDCVRIFGLPENSVLFTGPVVESGLLQIYRSCALYAASAWHEGFAFSALEAMSCGAAVVGANTSGVAEMIGYDNALFDPFSVRSIADKLGEMLVSDRARATLAAHCRQRAASFSWERSARLALSALSGWNELRMREGRSNAAIDPENDGTLTDAKIVADINAVCRGKSTEQDWIAVARAVGFNHAPRRKPLLAIDISQLVVADSQSGIQRVVRNLAAELLRDRPHGFDVRLVYATVDEVGYRFADAFTHKLLNEPVTYTRGEQVDLRRGDIFVGLDLKHAVASAQDGYYEYIRQIGVKVYFVVYDLLPLTVPHAFHKGVATLHEEWLRLISKSDGLIAISKTVADELMDWLNESVPPRERPLKIGWFHLGADLLRLQQNGVLPDDAGDVLSGIRARPAFLIVSTLEPRKGHLQTLMAFEMLWNSGVEVNLVFVGKYGWNVELLIEILRTHPERNKRLFWLEGISDQYLAAVYEASVCLIAPSEGEGFGLPLIEAAQHALPVIARDIPVFREVAGNTAVFFENVTDARAIVAAVTNWLDAKAERTSPSRGVPPLTWTQSATQFRAVVFSGKWYRTWMPRDSFRAYANDSRLCTQVGNRMGRELVTTGTAGCLLFGPYIPLLRGEYRVSVFGSVCDDAYRGAYADVICEDVEQVLTSTPLVLPGNNGLMATMVVALPENKLEVQVRIWVTEASVLSIRKIAIDRISESRLSV
jgi:glycosyltransferase involved in cell wall biosynthesis